MRACETERPGCSADPIQRVVRVRGIDRIAAVKHPIQLGAILGNGLRLAMSDAQQRLLVVQDRPIWCACAIRSRTLHPSWASNVSRKIESIQLIEQVRSGTRIPRRPTRSGASVHRSRAKNACPHGVKPVTCCSRSILTGEEECSPSPDCPQACVKPRNGIAHRRVCVFNDLGAEGFFHPPDAPVMHIIALGM